MSEYGYIVRISSKGCNIFMYPLQRCLQIQPRQVVAVTVLSTLIDDG